MSDADDLLDLIRSLVDGYRENLLALQDTGVLEAVIRQEYLDPFWVALGWDVANSAHRSPAEKDVVIEAPVSTIEAEVVRSRRPDYIFRIDGFPKFVVEAKKPAVDVAHDKDAIFQAKTYAWSAQIPFVILTNFYQFRLFDATIKPYHQEPQRGLIVDFDLRFEDYVPQWDVLRNTFSRDAVASGSLERLLASVKRIAANRRVRGVDRMLIDLRGSDPVDRVFLAHLEAFRLRFAKTLFENNSERFTDANTRHGAAKLTEATQRLIDRLVFMRVCEDRDIITWGQLRATLEEVSQHRLDFYPTLVAQFREFDHQYNGYLFKPHFSEELTVSAELLATFVRSLYPPEGPYRFDAIGDDLLGIIYERFLGSTITVNHRQVEAEKKPEVRHSEGVYYTPQFVVKSIIRRLLAPLLEGKTPLEVCKIKILDPACGSGSFLIAAFQYLMDYCCRYISRHPDAAKVPQAGRAKGRMKVIAVKGRDEQWSLVPEFRAQLLTSCIHGVDIDAQAVEVTIMSLYLKLLENMPSGWQKELIVARLLPPLDNNIRCGNSLLSQPEFENYWDETHGGLFAPEEDVTFRINAFDWRSVTHGFGRVFADRDGFDCIMMNPPYIRVQELKKWAPEECEFYKWRYKSAAKGNYDLYVAFVERSLELLSNDGMLGLICPHKFWQATYGAGLRHIIANGLHYRAIVDFGKEQAFRGATTYTAIHGLSKASNPGLVDYVKVKALVDGEAQCRRIDAGDTSVDGTIVRYDVPHPSIHDSQFSFTKPGDEVIPAQQAKQCVPLKSIAALSQGFKTGADKVFVVDVVTTDGEFSVVRSRQTGNEHRIEKDLLRALIKSEHMRRFEIVPTRLGLLFPYLVDGEKWRIWKADEMAARYPVAWSGYLVPLRAVLEKREKGRFAGDRFYQYSRQQNFVPLSKPKIISPDIADRVRFSFDESGQFVFSGGAAGGVGIIPDRTIKPELLLGILNSKLIEAQLRQTGTVFRGGWLNCEIRFLRGLPIHLPKNALDRKVAEEIKERVKSLLRAKSRLQGECGDRERERLQRDAESQEKRIDELVCRLYGVREIPS